MKPYHKIISIFKRGEKGEMIMGAYSDPTVEYLAGNEWLFTEKVDGTNIRVQWDGLKAKFCGKSDNAQIPPFLLDRLAELFPDKLLKLQFGGGPACLYGEGFGARIQKGGGNYIPDGVDFTLFDVCIGDLWLQREDVVDVADGLNIRAVPALCCGTLKEMVATVKEGFGSFWGSAKAEGLVARPVVEMRTRRGDRVITKLKARDFRENRA